MLGVGVGFDTKGAGTINIVAPGSAEGLQVWSRMRWYVNQKQVSLNRPSKAFSYARISGRCVIEAFNI